MVPCGRPHGGLTISRQIHGRSEIVSVGRAASVGSCWGVGKSRHEGQTLSSLCPHDSVSCVGRQGFKKRRALPGDDEAHRKFLGERAAYPLIVILYCLAEFYLGKCVADLGNEVFG